MFCSKCGTRIGDNDAFCKRCGAETGVGSASSGSRGSFLGKAVASYALGKAANAAMDSAGVGIPNRNPNADRYAEIQKNASRRAISGRDKDR